MKANRARTRRRVLRSLLDARLSASSFAWLGRVSRYDDLRPRFKRTKLAAYKGRRFRGVRVRAPSHPTFSRSVFSPCLSFFLLFSLFSPTSFLSSSFFFVFFLPLSDCLSRFFCSVPSRASRFLSFFPSPLSFSSDSIDHFGRFLGITNYATNGSTAAG